MSSAKFEKIGFRRFKNYKPSNIFVCVNTILVEFSSKFKLEEVLKFNLDTIVTTLFEQDVTLLNYIIYLIRTKQYLIVNPNSVKDIWEVTLNVLNYIDSENNRDFTSKAGKYKTYLNSIGFKLDQIPHIVRMIYEKEDLSMYEFDF